MTTTRPPTDPILESVVRLQNQYSLFPQSQLPSQSEQERLSPVVVAVSGGADSVCLLHILYTLRKAWHLDLHIAHFDHAIRPSSAADAQFVQNLAEQLHLPFHLDQASPFKQLHGGNLVEGNLVEGNKAVVNEATLRTLRYTFLCDIACKITAPDQTPLIAVAHHADDQAETILFRLTRGAGMLGLSAIQPVTQFFATELKEYVRIARPLLDVRRSEIIRYLHENSVAWREDPSNLALDYARNRIRHKVMPELLAINANAVEAMARSAKLLNESAMRLEKLDRVLLQSLQFIPTQGRSTLGERMLLDLQKFQRLEQAEQRAVLHLALRELTQTQGATEFSFEQIEGLRNQLQRQMNATQVHPISDDWVWSVIAQGDNLPLLLSLHRSALSPRFIDHPQLPDDFIPLSLQSPTTIRIDKWLLHSSEIPRQTLPNAWRTNTNPWQAWLDAENMSEPLLSSWKEGMQIAPLGMNGKSKSMGDFFTDRKIHPSERDRWPIIVERTNGQPLWVCGLAVSHLAQIRETTKQVLWLRWEKDSTEQDSYPD